MPKAPFINTRIDRGTYHRVIDWAKRHLIPNCRVLKRLLQLLPWDDDSKIMVVLGIDKRLLKEPEELRAALEEAVELFLDETKKGTKG